jgi:hypothetical protein
VGLALSRRGAGRWFRSEADRMLALARALSPADAARRVLIRRLTGIEDSSRYWSVYMTLEHLVMVDGAMLGVIESLAAGRPVERVAAVADFKPPATADATSIDRFDALARDFSARTDALSGWDSKLTFKHPWFGPLRVPQWHRLAAFHHNVHRKQIERIIRGLPKGG